MSYNIWTDPSIPMFSGEKNGYCIPNLDINKVITQEIQYYLGPESIVRPYTREAS